MVTDFCGAVLSGRDHAADEHQKMPTDVLGVVRVRLSESWQLLALRCPPGSVPDPRYLDGAFPATNSIDNPARFADYFPDIRVAKLGHNTSGLREVRQSLHSLK
jgi:hypothetical protein